MKGFRNLRQLERYRAHKAGERQAVTQPLYDHLNFDTSAGPTELLFFQLPMGQGTTSAPGATGGKTIADTNMQAAGQLPAGKLFLVNSIEVSFYPGLSPTTLVTTIAVRNFINDVYAFYKSGSLEFLIGSKPQLQLAPLDKFPPTNRLEVIANHALHELQATAANAEEQISSEYAAAAGRPFIFDKPILIEPNENFHVSLKWPVAVALPSSTDARVGVHLNGSLIRNAQ